MVEGIDLTCAQCGVESVGKLIPDFGKSCERPTKSIIQTKRNGQIYAIFISQSHALNCSWSGDTFIDKSDQLVVYIDPSANHHPQSVLLAHGFEKSGFCIFR